MGEEHTQYFGNDIGSVFQEIGGIFLIFPFCLCVYCVTQYIYLTRICAIFKRSQNRYLQSTILQFWEVYFLVSEFPTEIYFQKNMHFGVNKEWGLLICTYGKLGFSYLLRSLCEITTCNRPTSFAIGNSDNGEGIGRIVIISQAHYHLTYWGSFYLEVRPLE